MSTKTVKVRFWISSNRGTNESAIVHLPIEVANNENQVISYLEDWCNQLGAWNHSDNIVQYGYEVKTPKRKK